MVSPTPTAPSSPTSSPGTAAAASPDATDPGTASPAAPELPTQAPAEHGGTAVAVYLAVTDQGFDSPPVQQAQVAASELGYEAGVGGLGCDRGAAEALGRETDSGQTWAAVALYFATLEEAEVVRDAAERAGHAVAGVAEVTTYCLD